jgi:2-C-methyl-D-erythritol 4-phosphate cytidylyltransferase
MNIALILAGGTGQRTNQDIPKQFLHVNNKPVLIYTLEAFQTHPNIDSILVVCLEGWHDILKAYAKQFNIGKLKWIVSGGATRQDSVHNGLLELKKTCDANDVVLIHDGNRPMVSGSVIDSGFNTFGKYGSAIAAIPCLEAVFKSSDGGVSSDVSVPRQDLFRTQTPYVCSLKKLLWAYEQAQIRGIINTTATCTLMQQLGERVYFSSGSEKNIKITTIEDIEIFKALLSTAKEDWLK